MNDNLRNEIASWCRGCADGQVDMAETDGPLELTWPRAVSHDYGYMSVFSDGNTIVDVQYGTFADPDAREQRGMTRIPIVSLADGLTRLKAVIDAPKPVSTWIYTPRVDIGHVASLKFTH